MFLPSKHLLSAIYEALPCKNVSKNLVLIENPYRRLLRTLLRSTCCSRTFSEPFYLRSVLLHDPVGVHHARRKSTKINFGGPETPGGMGVFHAKGWWSKSSCPPSKVCLPWVWKGGTRDVPGILPGCPGPLGVFKKFVQKECVRSSRSLSEKDEMRCDRSVCGPCALVGVGNVCDHLYLLSVGIPCDRPFAGSDR